LEILPLAEVKIGDLEDLEQTAGSHGTELLIGNSHCAQGAQRLGVPLMRLGIPQYDTVGGYQRECIGYRGARQLLFDLANLRISHNAHEIAPYRSRFGQKLEYRNEGHDDGIATAVARS
jgi:nitrogenase molybdenum-iron protein NifN